MGAKLFECRRRLGGGAQSLILYYPRANRGTGIVFENALIAAGGQDGKWARAGIYFAEVYVEEQEVEPREMKKSVSNLTAWVEELSTSMT